MRRLYQEAIEQHLHENRQMLFLMGPRQVGKTTTGRDVGRDMPHFRYYNWDRQADRRLIVGGADDVAEDMHLERLRDIRPVALFDELHKYSSWKQFLKGFFDCYGDRVRIMVTGSSRLDVYKAGGDSLMGRYFSYRMHPLSIAELLEPGVPAGEIRNEPGRIDDAVFTTLFDYGGFPEPFLRNDSRFSTRWRRLRTDLLFREDLRDLTRIAELGQLRVLAEVLRERVGQLVSYTSLANEINVSLDTVRRWLATLSSFYYCFPVRPWFRNVSRALRKEPKYYLWDWSAVADRGARAENMVACAMLKATHFWTDHGFGEFGLYFVRDKQKREVDFLVARDNEPWFLVEVKSSGHSPLSRALGHFQEQTGAPHAFQAALDLEPIRRDCFSTAGPVVVPLRTILAQLV